MFKHIILFVNVDPHFKMLPTFYRHFNFSRFPKRVHKVEINKKKSREAWENNNRKDDIGT